MPEDVIETEHWQRIEQDEDGDLASHGLVANTRQSRPFIVEPSICDEQEWHRF